MQHKKIVVAVALVVAVLFIVGFSLGFAQETLKHTRAPINPDYLKYLDNLKQGKIQSLTANGKGLGFIPPTVDLSHTKGQKIYPIDKSFAPPSFYDLRSTGKVTPIRNQGSAGSCWAHAAYASLESCLLPAETWDFSENNMKNLLSTTYSYYSEGFNRMHDDGGNHYKATAYLARWSGPILETDDPYNATSGLSPMDKSPKKRIMNVDFIPERDSYTDNDNIKYAIMNYGAVYSSYYHNDSYYNGSHYAYYYNGASGTNHAIALVGWNDDFPASYFTSTPPGNGAFIFKNSWGTYYGENGYFYISYYDTNIGTYNAVFRYAEPTTSYNRVYQYDPLGWTDGWGFLYTYTGWFAAIYTAADSDQLAAVSFYAGATSSSYEIYVYDDVSVDAPRSGTLVGTKTGTIAVPGYSTIVLDSPFTLTAGRRFSVVVKLTTPGYAWPIPIEDQISGAGGSSLARANQHETYYSDAGVTWTDTEVDTANASVCLNALTQSAHVTSSSNWQLYR
ncbi:MAG: lectin like domain-containing protein [bacterium]